MVSRMKLGSDYNEVTIVSYKTHLYTHIGKVCVGYRFPEYQSLIIHLSDGITGSIEEWLQQVMSSIARQQQTQVLVNFASG